MSASATLIRRLRAQPHDYFFAQVPLKEVLFATEAPNTLPQVRELALGDRDIYDKGKLAFVSYIR